MERVLDQIVNKINMLSNKRDKLALALEEVSRSGKFSKIKTKVGEVNLNKIKICGVDGGFLKKEYHGAGLILRRAVASCFYYKDGQLEKNAYFPNNKPMLPLV